MAHDDELRLIQRFQRGDPEAFRMLFEACTPELQARLRRRFDGALRRKLSIADVMQEARVAAWEDRAHFEDRGPHAFRKWVLGILDHRVRRARDEHGAQKRDVGLEVTRDRRAATADVQGPQPSPSQWAIAGELHERARAAIDALPEPYREVVRLAHGEKLNLREIADRIGKSYDATRKVHARALMRLSAVLRPDAGGDDG